MDLIYLIKAQLPSSSDGNKGNQRWRRRSGAHPGTYWGPCRQQFTTQYEPIVKSGHIGILIKPISRHYYDKNMLCSCFVYFWDSLQKSSTLSIRLLSKLCKDDQRTGLCQILTNIERYCGHESQLTITICKRKNGVLSCSGRTVLKNPNFKRSSIYVRMQKLFIDSFNDDDAQWATEQQKLAQY